MFFQRIMCRSRTLNRMTTWLRMKGKLFFNDDGNTGVGQSVKERKAPVYLNDYMYSLGPILSC